jgi:hypothetical protein
MVTVAVAADIVFLLGDPIDSIDQLWFRFRASMCLGFRYLYWSIAYFALD